MCTSRISRPDLVVESIVVTLLTHYFAVRSYRPKIAHILQNQNARHALAERTTNRQNQTAWSVLAVVDGIPLNTHGGAHPRRTTRRATTCKMVKYVWQTAQEGWSRLGCCVPPEVSRLIRPPSTVQNAIFVLLEVERKQILLQDNHQ